MTLRLLLPPSVGRARAQARAELLDQSLRADLAEPVRVEVASDYDELARRSVEGSADLVWLPPTIAARVERTVHALYTCVRDGRTAYRSAILVPAGGATELAALRATRAAWVDPMSIGGHLLAAAALRRAGVDPERDLTSQTFRGSYPEALRAVLEGDADFTAVTTKDDSAESLARSLATYGGQAALSSLAAIPVEGSAPNDAVGLTRALSEKAAGRLASRVFDRREARARAALCLAFDAEGFVRAEDGDYAGLRALLETRGRPPR